MIHWKTWPMGAATSERMEKRGLWAMLSHAVDMDEMRPLCGVKLASLVNDSSQWTHELPDCPRCRQKIRATGSDTAERDGILSEDPEHAATHRQAIYESEKR